MSTATTGGKRKLGDGTKPATAGPLSWGDFRSAMFSPVRYSVLPGHASWLVLAAAR